jgi:hypothetical protein
MKLTNAEMFELLEKNDRYLRQVLNTKEEAKTNEQITFSEWKENASTFIEDLEEIMMIFEQVGAKEWELMSKAEFDEAIENGVDGVVEIDGNFCGIGCTLDRADGEERWIVWLAESVY